MDIKIRQANLEDMESVIAGILLLIKELRNSENNITIDYIHDTYSQLMEKKSNTIILIAETNSKRIVGIITLNITIALHCGKYGIIEEFWVCNEFRNCGIGSKLVCALEEYCRTIKITRIDVGLPNEEFNEYENTLKFYTKNGYKNIGLRKKKVLE